MPFRLSVTSAGRLQAARTIFVTGRLESGRVRVGVVARVEGDTDRAVLVKSIAIVDEKVPSGTITISIEPPDFPVDELVGEMLVAGS